MIRPMNLTYRQDIKKLTSPLRFALLGALSLHKIALPLANGLSAQTVMPTTEDSSAEPNSEDTTESPTERYRDLLERLRGDSDESSSSSRVVSCRQCDRPDFPRAALEAGVEGSVTVNAQYDANGTVTEVSLVSSSGNFDLDQAAFEAAQNYVLETGGHSGDV